MDHLLDERVERLMETVSMTLDRYVELSADINAGLQRMEALLRAILAALEPRQGSPER